MRPNKETLARAGISHALARILLEDPSTFQEKIGRIKRAFAPIIHPDHNPLVDPGLPGSVFNALDELQTMDFKEVDALRQELDAPLSATFADEQLALKFENEQLQERLRETEDHFRQQIGSMVKHVSAQQQRANTYYTSAIQEMIWDSVIHAPRSLLFDVERKRWSPNRSNPKSSLKSLSANLYVIENGLVYWRYRTYEINDATDDSSGRQTYFLGATPERYFQEIEQDLEAFRDEIRADILGTFIPLGILIGYAKPSPELRKVLQGISRKGKMAEVLQNVHISDNCVILASHYVDRLKRVATSIQPRSDDYHLALWGLGTEPATLQFKPVRKLKTS